MIGYDVLVTGGAGFIGSHLVDRLVSLNYRVAVIDDLSTGNIINVNPKVKFLKLDIRNKSFVNEFFEKHKFNYIFHLGAQINLRHSILNPDIDANTNILGTINLLNNCKNIKKFIFTSTGGAIYAPNYNCLPWTEEDQVSPQSPYGLSKLCAEKYIELLSKQLNFNYTILRLSNVYGPRQNNSECGIISIFDHKIKNNLELTIFGNGEQTRDFIYISDVIDALCLSIVDSNISNKTLNVSTGIETSINELSTIMGAHIENIQYKPAIEGELVRSCLNNSYLKSMGWNNKIDLKTGIELLKW